jgi:hypothetical protein
VYHLTDTHWNDAGAFTAYRRIVSHLRRWFPTLDAIPRSAVVESRRAAPGGDLAGLLALKAELPEGEQTSLSLPRARARVADPGVAAPRNTPPHARPRALEVDDPALPRALVFHDSFANALLPFLSEHFRRSVYLSVHDFPTRIVDRERPDVVIEELLERYLMMAPPPNPSALRRPRSLLPGVVPVGMDESHRKGELLPTATQWMPHEVQAVRDGGIMATGTDPFLTTAVTPFDAAPHQILWVRMVAHPARESAGGPRSAQLFWSTRSTNFEETASQCFPILVDGREHEYRVLPSLSPAWNGSIENLRLDFPDDEPGLRYEVREIELSR